MATNVIWRESDGTFTVVAERRANHHTCRVRAWFRGERQTTEAAPTAERAEAAARRIWSDYQAGIFDRPTDHAPVGLGAAVDRFVAREELSPSTRRSYAQALGLFLRSAGEDREIVTIGARDVTRWLSSLDVRPASVASYHRTLRAFFRYAISAQWHPGPCPTDGADLPRVVQEVRPWLSSDLWPRFLAECSPAHRIRAEFVLETALRAGEMIHARRPWLHGTVGRKALRVADDPSQGWRPKWGRARAVPLSRRAEELLDEAEARWGSDGWIFSGDSPLAAAGNLRRETVRACIRAGLPPVDFHGLRRSAGSRWLELGLSMHEVSRLLGHRSVTTTERWYAGTSDTHLAALIRRVDDAKASLAGHDKDRDKSHATRRRVP